MTAFAGLLLGVGALLALGPLAVAFRRGRWASPVIYGGAFLVCGLMSMESFARLLAGAPAAAMVLPFGLPWLGAHFRIDSLSNFFLAVVNFGGAAASFYALGYGRHETAPGRVLPFFPVFLAAMNLVVLADDAFIFLLSWELMSRASWALVMAHHREGDNVRAGYVYLLMATLGTFALMLAFGLLAGAGGHYAFAAMRADAPAPAIAGVVLALALVGAGSKAGLTPLHVWLPLAHPAAPSHVSALMSGIMTKVAVYGFLRIVFDLIGPAQWWWGVPVLASGAAAAVVGV
ncbi:proton-conducting transporter membrane subunit, partial [Rhodoblastus sp.]|uniref:proton-conducting transporter transmembrane domain-containing protein n=1 Tax=Rhodoblastus sp. TaxID=1962975 RepID=UPI00261D2A8C